MCAPGPHCPGGSCDETSTTCQPTRASCSFCVRPLLVDGDAVRLGRIIGSAADNWIPQGVHLELIIKRLRFKFSSTSTCAISTVVQCDLRAYEHPCAHAGTSGNRDCNHHEAGPGGPGLFAWARRAAQGYKGGIFHQTLCGPRKLSWTRFSSQMGKRDGMH